MSMAHQKSLGLKALLDRLPPGFMTDAAWLKRQGVDPRSIHEYVERGWLERVAHGVYRRPLPPQAGTTSETDWQAVLLSLQWILEKDVHLGGLSALEARGHAHYLSLGGPGRVYLYGDVPSWLRRLPVDERLVIRSRSLFGTDPLGVESTEQSPGQGTDSGGGPMLSPWRWPMRLSSPERAILEVLDELPDHESFHNVDMIFQGLTNLRPRRLMSLLQACRSVKVKRLFFVFADKHGHAWLKHIDKAAIDLGSGPRALVKGGKLHPAYQVYVPADMVPAVKDGDGAYA
ncbi:type IV toxin-antitoxin system AbiEi family antitoxin domain-containing protein [Microvirga sp. KLBC 81]|uniref:type IV toxin-antitoxin system AbiEi family antitoxin domain-containing protein n=1 Tax=Microvirga sp. KLBC 81 TaxID=1862707 RepID=UPI0026D20B13